MVDATIKVEGMSCMHCVMRVKKALESLKGIQSSDVQIGVVKVTFDDSSVKKEEIEKAITNAGYKVAA
jgi:copper chaperone